MTEHAVQPNGFFYGLQPHWLSPDRLYRIYIGDRIIAGAYVAGQFYDHQSATVQLQQLGWILRPMIRRLMARRQDREACYDALDPFDPSFLDHDPRNFHFMRTDIARTRFRRNRSYWTPFNVGVVEFELLDGMNRRFILAGDQQPESVLEIMRRVDPAVEVSGKPNPRPRPRSVSLAQQPVGLTLAGILLIGLAAVFTCGAAAGLVPGGTYLMCAALYLLLGGLCLVRAWSISRGQLSPDNRDDTDRYP
jgi:hypothetical protein